MSKGFFHRGVTFQSIWHLFKSVEKNSRRNTPPPLFRLRQERKKATMNIHNRIHDSIRYPLGSWRGQVTALSVLTSPRILFDGSPREISVREPKLSEPPRCARGQGSTDPGRWDVAAGPKVNRINSTWPRPWSKVLFVYVCPSVDTPAPHSDSL